MTDKSVASEPLMELISSLEASSSEEEQSTVLPTPLQLYQIGLLMHDLKVNITLAQTYQEWLAQVPFSYLKNVLFHDLNAAFVAVVSQKKEEENNEQSWAAVNSLSSLYANSSVACQAGFSTELCTSMASMYDKCQVIKKSPQQEECCISLLRGLSALLLDGLLVSNNNEEESHLERVMEVVRALTANDKSTCLGDLQLWQPGQQNPTTLRDSIQSQFDATPQREYLLKMLDSCPTTSRAAAQPTSVTTAPKEKAASHKPAISELERRIQQVQEVLPELGEGYIETALSCYQGDVSRTLAALLEGQANPTSLHPTLQVMDQKLPARKHETPKSSRYQLDDEEAKRITKSRLVQMEQQQEAAAYALSVMNSEYNDDYDDQYDGMDGGGTGGADVGMYDVDLDTIKTYNRVAREAEQEESFWEETKNLNRPAKKNHNGGDGEKQYRGPDKGRGGRMIGPDGKYVPFQKGGKKGRQQEENAKKAAAENGEDKKMKKIQQRRKNDNKAKIANHHRKERAQKKAAGGM